MERTVDTGTAATRRLAPVNETENDKRNIRTVCSESFAVLIYLATSTAHGEDSDQNGCIPRLV